MNKKLIASVMAGIMALGLAACGSKAPATETPSETPTAGSSTAPIKIGVISSSTGTMAGRGEYMRNALKLATDEINNAGGLLGGRKIELIQEDDQSDQTTAINMMNKMGSNKDIVAVFGPHTSTNAIAVSNTVMDYKIPYFTGGTSAKLKTLGNKYMFKVRANDQIVVASAMKFATQTLGAKKIGILYINDEFGVGGKDIMVQYAKDNNLEYVEANHNGTDQDLTSQIMTMKQANVDVLIAWSSNVCPIVARQTTELGFDKPVIMNSGFGGQDVLDSLPTAATEGKYASADFTAEDPAPEVVEFVKVFETAFNKKPLGDWAASYYGAMKMLAEAITVANSTDREKITETMYTLKDFNAPLGKLTTDKDGVLVHEAAIIQAQVQPSGKSVFKLVEKVKESGY